MKLNNLIKKHKDKFIIKTGVTQKDITDAEKRLKIKFTDELKEYFLEFGALRFLSMELKGLGYQSPNRNIVINTIKARKNASIPKNAVVLEDIGEFHYVIYNNENNNVIYWGNNKEIKIISKSLEKFLIKRIKEEIKNLEKEKKKYNKKTIHFIKNIEKFDKHLNQVIEKSKKEIYKKIKKLSNENPTQKQQIQEVLQDVKEYKMNSTTSFNNLNVHYKKTKKLKSSLLKDILYEWEKSKLKVIKDIGISLLLIALVWNTKVKISKVMKIIFEKTPLKNFLKNPYKRLEIVKALSAFILLPIIRELYKYLLVVLGKGSRTAVLLSKLIEYSNFVYKIYKLHTLDSRLFALNSIYFFKAVFALIAPNIHFFTHNSEEYLKEYDKKKKIKPSFIITNILRNIYSKIFLEISFVRLFIGKSY